MKYAIKKSLQHLIELEWITINPLVNFDAIVLTIEGDLNQAELEGQKRKEIETLIGLLSKYFPDKIESVLGK